MIKILAFAGSTREESFNKKLLKTAVYGARDAGAEVTVIDLKDYHLPIFDEDFELKNGLPRNAQELKTFFISHHGLMMALPEYNSSMSGVFKNVIDWVSRSENGEPPLHCFVGKVAGLMSASPGYLGGMRGLIHTRSMLENLNVLVMPEQVSISNAHEAFDEFGNLINEVQKKSIEKLGANIVDLALRYKGYRRD